MNSGKSAESDKSMPNDDLTKRTPFSPHGFELLIHELLGE